MPLDDYEFRKIVDRVRAADRQITLLFQDVRLHDKPIDSERLFAAIHDGDDLESG